jgi:hypothetical protein
MPYAIKTTEISPLVIACLIGIMSISACGAASVGYDRSTTNHMGQEISTMRDFCSGNCLEFSDAGSCIVFHRDVAATCAEFEAKITSVSDDRIERTREATSLIAEFATEFCGSISQSSEREQITVRGDVSVGVGQLLQRLTDLGISGAGEYEREITDGLRQDDLVEGMRLNTNCRMVVFERIANSLGL